MSTWPASFAPEPWAFPRPGTRGSTKGRLSRRTVIKAAGIFAALALAAAAVAQAPDPPRDEGSFLQMINEVRAAHGKSPLNADPHLAGVGRTHSQKMAQAATIYHNPQLDADVGLNLPWQSIGENVGVGPAVPPLMDAFMKSPAHKANILGDYDRLGVGIVVAADNIYVTQVFWKTKDAAAPAPATAGPAPAGGVVGQPAPPAPPPKTKGKKRRGGKRRR